MSSLLNVFLFQCLSILKQGIINWSLAGFLVSFFLLEHGPSTTAVFDILPNHLLKHCIYASRKAEVVKIHIKKAKKKTNANLGRSIFSYLLNFLYPHPLDSPTRQTFPKQNITVYLPPDLKKKSERKNECIHLTTKKEKKIVVPKRKRQKRENGERNVNECN